MRKFLAKTIIGAKKNQKYKCRLLGGIYRFEEK
jgi:hypothetical protein